MQGCNVYFQYIYCLVLIPLFLYQLINILSNNTAVFSMSAVAVIVWANTKVHVKQRATLNCDREKGELCEIGFIDM